MPVLNSKPQNSTPETKMESKYVAKKMFSCYLFCRGTSVTKCLKENYPAEYHITSDQDWHTALRYCSKERKHSSGIQMLDFKKNKIKKWWAALLVRIVWVQMQTFLLRAKTSFQCLICYLLNQRHWDLWFPVDLWIIGRLEESSRLS